MALAAASLAGVHPSLWQQSRAMTVKHYLGSVWCIHHPLHQQLPPMTVLSAVCLQESNACISLFTVLCDCCSLLFSSDCLAGHAIAGCINFLLIPELASVCGLEFSILCLALAHALATSPLSAGSRQGTAREVAANEAGCADERP